MSTQSSRPCMSMLDNGWCMFPSVCPYSHDASLEDPRLKSEAFSSHTNIKDDVVVGKAARKKGGSKVPVSAGTTSSKAPPNHKPHTTNQLQNAKSSQSSISSPPNQKGKQANRGKPTPKKEPKIQPSSTPKPISKVARKPQKLHDPVKREGAEDERTENAKYIAGEQSRQENEGRQHRKSDEGSRHEEQQASLIHLQAAAASRHREKATNFLAKRTTMRRDDDLAPPLSPNPVEGASTSVDEIINGVRAMSIDNTPSSSITAVNVTFTAPTASFIVTYVNSAIASILYGRLQGLVLGGQLVAVDRGDNPCQLILNNVPLYFLDSIDIIRQHTGALTIEALPVLFAGVAEAVKYIYDFGQQVQPDAQCLVLEWGTGPAGLVHLRFECSNTVDAIRLEKAIANLKLGS